IRRWRDERDGARIEAALAVVRNAAEDPDADLMRPIVAALDDECSIGEITGALRAGYGLPSDPFTAR
ncbi:MAG TPA: methylmalonyl-CoA mutase family protein, partial [Solirubrobacteraceae bacterium]